LVAGLLAVGVLTTAGTMATVGVLAAAGTLAAAGVLATTGVLATAGVVAVPAMAVTADVLGAFAPFEALSPLPPSLACPDSVDFAEGDALGGSTPSLFHLQVPMFTPFR
jgi:hypothetical protein